LKADALHDLPAAYTVHDARHSYAVRHVKLGTPYKRIAHNLGHADELQVIKVYGKHRLSDQEVANQSQEMK
jgi:integrase